MTTAVSSLRVTALAVLIFAPALAAQPPLEFARQIYPADIVTAHGDEVWQAYRAIDGITGQPIAGAELFLVDERQAPIRGEFWFRHRAVGDADGFVRIRTDDKKGWHWLVLRAPGYGPAMSMNAFEEATVPLAVAQEVPVRVFDVQGRPTADALIGFCSGCGHTPDLVHATTNAGGLAILRGIDLHNGIRDLYVEHPDLHLGYDSFRWFPGDPPAQFRPGKGIAVVGVVVDEEGKPVAGVPVGAPDVHRGPWTRTRDDGSFRLCGLDSGWDLFVVLPDHRVLFESPREMPYRLQVPEWDGETTQVVNLPDPPGPPIDESKLLDVELQTEVSGFEYTLVGPLPQQGVLEGETRDNFAREDLLPGSYELRVICEDHRELVQRIEVEVDAGNLFRLQPEPLPTVVVCVDGLPEDYWRVSLGSANGTRDIQAQVEDGLPVGIDDRIPVWFTLHGPQFRQRVLHFAPGAALKEPELRLQWFEPTLVRGRLVDAAGTLVPARVAVVSVGEEVRDFDLRELETTIPTDGRLSVPADAVGLTLFAVIPNDPALAPRLLALSLPERADGQEVDLGDVQLSATPRLTVVGAGDQAAFLRSGWSDLRYRGPFFPIERGRWLGPDPRAGDAILVPGAQSEGATEIDLAFRTVLTGDGPWTVRPPTGQLIVDVRSAAGEAVTARMFIRDQDVEVEGRCLLRRVPPGRSRVFIAAEGYQTAIAELDVPDDGKAILEVVLPPR